MANSNLIVAGSRILASVIQSVAPLAVIKGADQSVASNNTTLVNDNALFVPVVANGTYFWVMLLDYEGNTQGSGDLKFQITLPTGATARYWMGNISTGGASTTSFMGSQGASYSAGTGGAGNLRGLLAVGTAIIGGTPGNMQLQWCQNTSNATATIVHAQSALALWRVS